MRLSALILPLLAPLSLSLAACAGAPAASPTSVPITITASPTTLVHGSGPVLATFSKPIPNTPGKRYRISLSTIDAKTYSGPSQFLEPGATKHELRPVEAGTFDARLLESDGPNAENERVIAKSETITVTKKPE